MSDHIHDPDNEDEERDAAQDKLRHAVESNNLPLLREALAEGADPLKHESFCWDRTPLIEAAFARHPAVIRELLPLSDPGATDEDGDTALIVACYLGDLESVLALLPQSDPKHLNKLDNNALHAAAYSGHAECARALLPIATRTPPDTEGTPPCSRPHPKATPIA